MSKRLPKILTEQEQDAFIKQFTIRYPTPHRDLCIVRLMLEAGLRAGEVVILQPEDLDMMSCKLVVHGKGAKDRVVWINTDLRDLIGEWLGRRPDSEWLFPSRTGKQLTTTHLRQMVKRRAKEAGLPQVDRVSPHTFRHTFATELYRATKNIRLVQKALGHSDLSSTMIYTHVVDEELEDAMKNFRGRKTA